MGKQKNAKKGKKRRVPAAKIAYYWNHSHIPNMLRRAKKILFKEGRPAAEGFIDRHGAGCDTCGVILDAKFKIKFNAD